MALSGYTVVHFNPHRHVNSFSLSHIKTLYSQESVPAEESHILFVFFRVHHFRISFLSCAQWAGKVSSDSRDYSTTMET